MADTASSSPAPAATPKKAKAAVAAAAKKPRVKPAHPPTSDMVNAAIKSLKERGGSSLQAIKKYIAANYKVDAEKLAPFIRKYLKSAVVSGTLTQPKGKGASGSFKLSVKSEGKAATGVVAPKKAKTVSKPKGGEKKVKPAASAKKTGAAKKPAAASKKVAKPKSPSKAKKVSKPPTKKPKSPKPKKAAVKKPKTPKKSAAKKK